MYTDVIRLQTAQQSIRSNFVVGIGYEADMAQARRVAVEVLADVEGVASEPRPEVLYVELDSFNVDLDVQFWCDAHQLEMRRTLSRAIGDVRSSGSADRS